MNRQREQKLQAPALKVKLYAILTALYYGEN